MLLSLRTKLNDVFPLAVVAAITGGSTTVFAKIALEVFHPFSLIAVRFFFACLFLLPFVYKTGELQPRFFKQLWSVGLIGAINPILLFIALPFTTASVAPLIYASVPALTACYLYLTMKQEISRKQVGGILIGFLGVLLVILLPLVERGTPLAALGGNGLIFIGAIAFMFYGLMSKQRQQTLGSTPIALTFYFTLVAFLVSLPFTAWEISSYGISPDIGWPHILSAIFVGVVGTGISYVTYQLALKLSSEVSASLFMYIQPISTITLAALFLGEKISLVFVVGGILAVVGARLATGKVKKV